MRAFKSSLLVRTKLVFAASVGFFLLPGVSVFTPTDRLSVFPNVCNLDPNLNKCSVELSWENYQETERYIYVWDGSKETLVSSGASGRGTPSWITSKPLEFRLEDSNRNILAHAQAVGISVSSSLSNVALAPQHVQQDGNPTLASSQLSGFWDGRLFIGSIGIYSPPNNTDYSRYGWYVFLSRPETALESKNSAYLADASSLFKIPDLYSQGYILDTDSVPPGDNVKCPSNVGGCSENWNVNRAGMGGRLQVAAFPDPNYNENPYPSDDLGNYNATGAYETYKFYLVAQPHVVDNGNYDIAKLDGGVYFDMGFISIMPGTVVVQNPKTITASVYSAVVGQASVIKDTGGNLVIGKEPSVDLSGRMVTFGSNSHMFDSNYNGEQPPAEGEYFTYNATPGSSSGWSPLATLPDAYYLYGPGRNGGDAIVAGQPFSQRFPFASCPMKDYAGNLMETSAKGQPMQGGAYNWISQDASEVFTGVMGTWYGPARAGWTMVGRRTGCKLVLVDTSMNPARSDPLGNAVLNYDPNLKTEIAAAYDTMPEPNVSSSPSPVPHIYERILPSPQIVVNGAWNPWRDVSAQLATQGTLLPIPEYPEKQLYGLAHSGAHRYSEAPIPDNMADLVLYLPMNELLDYNEQLAYDDAYVSGYGASHDREWRTNWDPSHTPDLSQFSQNGTLENGAAFPFEYHNVVNEWAQHGVILDATDGARGNSVFMPSGAYVSLSLASAADSMVWNANRYTVSFWTRMQKQAQASLFNWPNRLNVSADGNGNYLIVQTQSDGSQLSTSVPMLSLNWTHFAIVFQGGTTKIYVNGMLAAGPIFGKGLHADSNLITIGPQSAASGNRVDMDEVMIYALALDNDAVSRLAFRRSLESENTYIPNGQTSPVPVSSGLPRNNSTASSVAMIPVTNPYNPSQAALALGQTLFNTTILSANGAISCASCHNNAAFSDNNPVSIGFTGPGIRNTPSLTDLAFSKAMFHDASAPMLESQVLHPILGGEFGGSAFNIVSQLNADTNLVKQFKSVYGAGPSLTLVAQSLANYVRSLTAANSPYDAGSMSDSAMRGFELFRGRANCIACHSGPDFTDGQLHDTGQALLPTDILPKGDLGAYWIQGAQSQTSAFKTMTLRNISLTGPYFHDGRMATLADVVNFYNGGGDISTLGRPSRDGRVRPLDLSTQDMTDLENFLNSLSSTVGQGNFVTPPAAPANLKITSTTNTSLSLSWQSSATSFVVAVVAGNVAATCSEGTQVGSGTSYTANNLQPGTPYQIAVCAEDSNGLQSASTNTGGQTSGSGNMSFPAGGILMTQGQSVSNSTLRFTMQTDGNLVLYANGSAVWSSNTHGACTQCQAAYQTDGNLVVMNTQTGQTVYSSGLASTTLTLTTQSPYVVFGY